MFQVLANSDGTLNPAAALQYATLWGCLYWDQQSACQNIVNILGGGSILAWNYQPKAWPPSWAIIQQNNTFIIAVCGTESAKQCLLHLGGAVATMSPQPGVYVHSLWLAVANSLITEMRTVLPTNLSNANIVVSGHSYGGSTGQLIANMFAAQLSPSQVSLITYGQPRSLSSGYTLPQPSVYFRVCAEGDSVTVLPPQGTQLFLSLAGLLLAGTNVPFIWQHYGVKYLLSNSGNLVLDPTGDNDDWFSVGEISTTIKTSHYTQNYISLLEQNWSKVG